MSCGLTKHCKYAIVQLSISAASEISWANLALRPSRDL